MTIHVAVTGAHQRRRDRVRGDLQRRLAPAVVAFAEFHTIITGTTNVTASDSERLLAEQIDALLSRLALAINQP